MSKNELQVHIEEYKSTQQIINVRCQAGQKINYWSILLLIGSISISLGLFARPEAQEYLYILLVLPFPFYLLAIMLLRNDLIIAANAKYYNKTLRPIVKKIISSNKDIWMREEKITFTRKGLFNKFLGVCRYGLTLIAFPIYSFIYFSLKHEFNCDLEYLDKFLFYLNLIIEFYIIYEIFKRLPKALDDIVNK
jgi:hypothetical protein